MSATAPPPARPTTYAADAAIARFTVPKYQRMIESGNLDDEDRVELLEGYVVLKMPRNPEHDATMFIAAQAITRALPRDWCLRIQAAVTLADSQPEPDVAVVRGSPRDFVQRHPGPADIGLIVEIANTSLPRDIIDKVRIYSRSGVPAYWVINLNDRRVEAFADPTGPNDSATYRARAPYQNGDSVPLILDGVTIAALPVADLLP